MSKKLDLIGSRFGFLSVVKRIGPVVIRSRNRGVMWYCLCDCRNKKIVSSTDLISKKVKSCGCLVYIASSINGKNNARHGMHMSSEYKTWQSIHQRCSNKNDKSYYRYGGRGIRVCREWKK